MSKKMSGPKNFWLKKTMCSKKSRLKKSVEIEKHFEVFFAVVVVIWKCKFNS